MNRIEVYPKIRFKSFSEPWIKGRLSNSCKTFDGTHQTPIYVDEGVRFLSVEDITDYDDNPKFISMEAFQKDFKVKPAKGDVFMTRITAGIIGATRVVEDDTPLGYYVSLALLKPKPGIDPYYLAAYINSPFFKHELHKRIIHVAFPKKINLEDIGECEFACPSLPEQKKLAAFFNNIDQQIRINEEKLVLLNNYKRAVINHAFFGKESKNYETISLSNVLHERKTYALNDDSYEHVTLSKEGVVPKTERYDRDFLVKDEDKKYKITLLNDICYNPANLKFGVIAINKYKDSIFSPIYVTYEVNPRFDKDLVFAFLSSNNFINYIRRYEEGTVYERMAVSSSDFLKGKMPILPDCEVKKLSKLLLLIDERIGVVSTKIENLKRKRLFYMQNMFI